MTAPAPAKGLDPRQALQDLLRCIKDGDYEDRFFKARSRWLAMGCPGLEPEAMTVPPPPIEEMEDDFVIELLMPPPAEEVMTLRSNVKASIPVDAWIKELEAEEVQAMSFKAPESRKLPSSWPPSAENERAAVEAVEGFLSQTAHQSGDLTIWKDESGTKEMKLRHLRIVMMMLRDRMEEE